MRLPAQGVVDGAAAAGVGLLHVGLVQYVYLGQFVIELVVGGLGGLGGVVGPPAVPFLPLLAVVVLSLLPALCLGGRPWAPAGRAPWP